MLYRITFANIYLGFAMWSFSFRIYLLILHLEIQFVMKIVSWLAKDDFLHCTLQPHSSEFLFLVFLMPWESSFWMRLVNILPQVSNWKKKRKEIHILKFDYILFSTVWLEISLLVYTNGSWGLFLLAGLGKKGLISTVLRKWTHVLRGCCYSLLHMHVVNPHVLLAYIPQTKSLLRNTLYTLISDIWW